MAIPESDGVRVLFRVDSKGPRGHSHFRMAAALRAPSGARLEFLGPLGGPRLVLATDGSQATAILPAERRFDRAPATSDSMRRLIGLPLDGARLIALLSGAPLCPPATAMAGAAPGSAPIPEGALERTCPPGDIRISGIVDSPGEPLRGAVLSDARSGATIARVDYPDRSGHLSLGWPRDIRVTLPSEEVAITLTALDGPAPARLPDDLFSPTIPEGFERGSIFGRADDPALFGASGDVGG